MQKILVAEDDKFLKNVYYSKLQKEGFEVEIASDGEEILKRVGVFKPDLIVMDIMMPKLNGLEALEKIKANPEYKNIPVIMTTNLDKKEDIERGLELGAVDYLIKSDISISDVIGKIKGYLEKA